EARPGSSRLGVPGGRSSNRLTRGQTGPDHSRRSERLVRRAHAAARDEEVLDVSRLKAAQRDIVVRPVGEKLVGGPEAPFLPQLDGPARPRDSVLELPTGQDVFAGELVAPDHATALADADLRGGVGNEGAGERGQCLEKFRDGEGAPASFLLGDRQKITA